MNGEIWNAKESNEDYAGAQIVKRSTCYNEALAVAYSILPPGALIDRSFINVRHPRSSSSDTPRGRHPPHEDTRKSSIILSFKFSYSGVGHAGEISYGLGKRMAGRVSKPFNHGDVGVYMGSLHQVATSNGIFHEVSCSG